MAVGPAHYFTAPTFQRFEPEGHSAVTHEFDRLRLVVIPEVPRRPLHIQKERLEGVDLELMLVDGTVWELSFQLFTNQKIQRGRI